MDAVLRNQVYKKGFWVRNLETIRKKYNTYACIILLPSRHVATWGGGGVVMCPPQTNNNKNPRSIEFFLPRSITCMCSPPPPTSNSDYVPATLSFLSTKVHATQESSLAISCGCMGQPIQLNWLWLSRKSEHQDDVQNGHQLRENARKSIGPAIHSRYVTY